MLVAACAALSASGADRAYQLHDFQSDYPVQCTTEEARAIFERHIRELRREHRAALERLADELAGALTGDQANSREAREKSHTPATESAVQKLLAILRSATDAQTAMLLAMQHRSLLSDPHQEHVAAVVKELSPLVEATRQAKLAFQPYLAEHIRRRWESLDLLQKQAVLREFFYLAGQSPEGLWQPTPKAPLPLPPAAVEIFLSFERQAQEQVRTAERAFQSRRAALLASLKAALQKRDANETEARAVQSLVTLLEADYGKGFRGLMLLEVNPQLPKALREEVSALSEAYQAELARLRADRAAQLGRLKELLAPLREVHLNNGEFTELVAIDIRLDELGQILRPLRILARREPGVEWPEEAWLLDVRGSDFQVRFVRDKHEVWLPREQVLLRRPATRLREDLAGKPTAGGPGVQLTDQTVLRAGQTLMGYHNQAWHPVTVVDVSPFGVEITWQGFRHDTSQLVPRSRLRLLNDQ